MPVPTIYTLLYIPQVTYTYLTLTYTTQTHHALPNKPTIKQKR